MGLVTFLTGDNRRLSDEAERGRKELLLVAAGLWVTPILATVRDFAGGFEGVDVLEMATSVVWNLAIFAALAKGRPWARKFTLFLTGLAAFANAWLVIAGPLDGRPLLVGGHITALINVAVFGSASWVLWRSPSVRAYFESQRTGDFIFPKT